MPALPLFAYGTLQDEDVLAAVLGRAIAMAELRRAVAPGFKAVAYPGRVYPALVACPGEAAPGRLVQGLDELDLAVLDAFEGGEYCRSTLTIEVDGAGMPAHAYLPVVKIAGDGPAWSFQHWLSVHKPGLIHAETSAARALRQKLG